MLTSERISLAGLALLGFVALTTGRYVAAEVEAQTLAAAETAIRSLELRDVAVKADGRNIEVLGRVGTVAERDDAMAALDRAVSGARIVDNLMIVEPLVDLRPAVLRIQKDERAITLSGEAPNAQARDLLEARVARAGGDVAVSNLMKTQDRRAESDWLVAAEAAIDALAALRVGRARVERGEVEIEGAADDATRRTAVLDQLRRRLRGGYKVVVSISAPPPLLKPYVFAARREPGGFLLESCAAPTLVEQARLLEALAARTVAGATAERCPVANGAPNQNWTAAALAALAALDALREGEARVVDDRAEVIGFADTAEAVDAARGRAAAGWPEGYTVTVEVRAAPPQVSPFEMTIVKRPGDARLAGYTPSLGKAEQWAEALDATNQLALARGAPEEWVDAAEVLVRTMRGLKIGVAELRDYTVRVAAPGDDSARAQLRSRLQADLPRRFRIEVVEAKAPRAMIEAVAAEAAAEAEAEAQVAEQAEDAAATADPAVEVAAALAEPSGAGAAPPRAPSLAERVIAVVEESAGDSVAQTPAGAARFVFVARRAAGGRIDVSGVVGDETARIAVASYARAKLGGEALTVDVSNADRSPPAGWQRALFAALDALALLSTGEAIVEPGAFYLRGGVRRAYDARMAVDAVKAKAPEDFTQFSWITVEEDAGALALELAAQSRLAPPLCVEAANRAMRRSGEVLFDPGEATLTAASDVMIEDVALSLRRCPEASIEIGGHTDNQGSDEANMTLSKRRAMAVRLALIARGVDNGRLSSEGYGAARPIAGNDTEAGRAQNRRIEFSLKP